MELGLTGPGDALKSSSRDLKRKKHSICIGFNVKK
jgi:hypothetical protein